MTKVNPKLLNIALLQAGWWSITLSYPSQLIYISITLILLSIHIIFNQVGLKEVFFILIGATVGGTFDYLAIQLNLWTPTDSYSYFPVWLICYWLIFLTSFSQSLNWLKDKLLLAGALGFIFGPLSYFAGENFSILSFNPIGNFHILITYAAYGLIWFVNYIILFNIFCLINKQSSRYF